MCGCVDHTASATGLISDHITHFLGHEAPTQVEAQAGNTEDCQFHKKTSLTRFKNPRVAAVTFTFYSLQRVGSLVELMLQIKYKDILKEQARNSFTMDNNNKPKENRTTE